jgi:hypothetical protein
LFGMAPDDERAREGGKWAVDDEDLTKEGGR